MEIVRPRVVFLLIFIFLISTGSKVYAWPFGGKTKDSKTASAAPKVSSGTASNGASGVRKFPVVPSTKLSAASSLKTNEQNPPSSASFFDDNEDNEETDPTVLLPKIPSLPKIPRATVKVIPTVSPLKSSSNGIPHQVIKPDPEILKIQQQIQQIIKINENLKSHYTNQAAEIQRISEQAKIHQKILRDLQQTRKIVAVSNPDHYLNQEKVRLIRAETEKNKKFIDTLQSPEASSKAKTAPETSDASKKDKKKSPA